MIEGIFRVFIISGQKWEIRERCFAATVTVTCYNVERINLSFVTVTVTAFNSHEFKM